MKKLISIFLILVVTTSVLCGCNSQTNSKVVNWVILSFTEDGYAASIEEPLNKLLADSGCDYTVNVIGQSAEEMQKSIAEAQGIGDPNTVDLNDLSAEYYSDVLKKSDITADIISLPYNTDNHEYYKEFADFDLLSPLDDFLNSDDGAELKNSVNESDIERLKINNKVYGMGSSIPLYSGVCFAKEVLDSYNIAYDSLSGILFENDDVFKTVAQSEAENPDRNGVLSGLNSDSFYSIDQYTTALYCNGYVVLGYNSQTQKVFNVFELESTKKWYEKDKYYYDSGYIKASYNYDILPPFAYSCLVFSDEITENFIDGEAVVYVPNTSFGIASDTIGATMAVYKDSKNKNNAHDFITKCFTNPEIANLAAYGTNYTVDEYNRVDGYVSVETNNYIINPPVYATYDSNAKEYAEAYYQKWHNDKAITNFDKTAVSAEITEIEAVIQGCDELINLGKGKTDNVQAELDKLNEKLYNAGLQKIIDEYQRQVDDAIKN